MQDLRLVGVHDDGEHLVLSTPDGTTFLILVDDALRAAVRLDRARLGQLQIQTEGRLRPRDIQARIRAGQTAEEVAEASGLPVEHIRRFEGPVLAEREFVVRQAQAVRVRRGARGASASLGDLVGERLAARAVEDEAQNWDAWRGDDGVWVVSLSFTAGARERQARWSYDAQLRHVTPRDDEARWLTEDEAEEPGQRPRRLTPVGGARREPEEDGGAPADGRPRDRVYDVEADGGVRPVEELRSGASTSTVDLLDSLRERRGRRQRPGPLDDPEFVSGSPTTDPMDAALHGGAPRANAGDTYDEPPAAHPPLSRPDQAFDDEVLALSEADLLAALGPFEDAVPPAAPAVTPDPAGRPGGEDGGDRSSRRARRASVPKWDDIVFGSRRD